MCLYRTFLHTTLLSSSSFFLLLLSLLLFSNVNFASRNLYSARLNLPVPPADPHKIPNNLLLNTSTLHPRPPPRRQPPLSPTRHQPPPQTPPIIHRPKRTHHLHPLKILPRNPHPSLLRPRPPRPTRLNSRPPPRTIMGMRNHRGSGRGVLCQMFESAISIT